MSAILVTAAVALCFASGLPSLLARRAGRVTTTLMIVGGLTGLTGSILGLIGAATTLSLPWQISRGAQILVRVDALSAFFVAPVFLLAAAGALYGDRYWPDSKPRAGAVRTFFGIMAGSLALVICAANTILFVAAWEIVAVTSFLLIATEDEKADSRAAAWIYLAASHVATLALFGIVAVLHATTQTWTFDALPHGIGLLPAGRALLWLGLVAFGTKAGVMPLHIWLPGAHAAAPTHVSALMSGVAIKMGIYGLVRLLSLFDVVPPWFAITLLVAGIVSSIFGVAFALAQHDLKRLLAYHSIENIGIIVTGLAIGLIAQANHQPLIALLGYAGALLHVWNHGLFKALLFLSAGSAIHGVHTREIDRMGGLAKRMPWTSAAFLTGAIAISGLPPLNGFVSEWLLYVASFTSMAESSGTIASLLLILVAPALALTGGLALACFVKAFGAVFLGEPRTAVAAASHESPSAMRIAMLPLALACVAIGVVPVVFAPALARAVRIAAPSIETTKHLAPILQPVQTSALIILTLTAIATLLVLRARRRAPQTGTWDCGYAAPTARMQYTSSSLASGLTSLFAWAMPPVVHGPWTHGAQASRLPHGAQASRLPHGAQAPRLRSSGVFARRRNELSGISPRGATPRDRRRDARPTLFPANAAFETHVPDTVLDRALLPTLTRGAKVASLARYIQHGRMQLYIVYLVVTLVVLLAWSAQ